jgi:ectoine hydroxylase-related dioxygenase (phytanoyl-CoA dioxygenase family)
MADAAGFFAEHGYYVAREVFTANEVAALRAHYMELWAGNSPSQDPTVLASLQSDRSDPLLDYPRLLQMHRWDEASRRFLLDARLRDQLTEILGTEPFAVQTMMYYKPAGARGQAIHQDQFYLKVQPGTCCAAWLALDDSDEENGCMQVVDGSHTWDLLCTIPADTTQSFTDVTVPLPEGVHPQPVVMQAGDVLFFNGSTVHGSYPNHSKDRFRRSVVGHYITGGAEKVGEFYHPVLRMDGSEVDLGVSAGATQCGIWVERDGTPVMEMVDRRGLVRQHE